MTLLSFDISCFSEVYCSVAQCVAVCCSVVCCVLFFLSTFLVSQRPSPCSLTKNTRHSEKSAGDSKHYIQRVWVLTFENVCERSRVACYPRIPQIDSALRSFCIMSFSIVILYLLHYIVYVFLCCLCTASYCVVFLYLRLYMVCLSCLRTPSWYCLSVLSVYTVVIFCLCV